MKKSSTKILSIILAGVLGAATLTGCGNAKETGDNSGNDTAIVPREQGTDAADTSDNTSDAEDDTGYDNILDYHYTGDPITVTFGNLTACVPFGVALDKGFIDEVFEGDNVVFEEYVVQGNGATVAQSLAAGDADFGFLGDQPAIAGVAADYGITVIGLNQYSLTAYPLVATAESGVTSVADLKGKKVGITYGTSMHYLTIAYLAAEGISVDDVEIVQSSDLFTLLQSGDIDAGIVFGTQAESIGGTILAAEADYGLRQESALAARTEFIEQYPELTAKFLYALNLADEWIAENPDEAAAITAERAQLTDEYVRWTIDNNHITVKIADEDIESFKNIIDFLEEYELIADTTITVDDVVDTKYLELAGLR